MRRLRTFLSWCLYAAGIAGCTTDPGAPQITGHLVGGAGEPVRGANVRLVFHRPGELSSDFEQAMATTNDEGEFTLPIGTWRGTATLCFEKRGHEPIARQVRLPNPDEQRFVLPRSGPFLHEPRNDYAGYSIGETVRLYEHEEICTGASVNLREVLKHDGLVLIWHSPICGKCRDFAARFAALASRYENWRVMAVYSGCAQPRLTSLGSARALRDAYESLNELALPVLNDLRQRYLEEFDLRRTPTVAVIGRDGRLLYVGPPWTADGQHSYLAPVLDAVEAGGKPPVYPRNRIREYG